MMTREQLTEHAERAAEAAYMEVAKYKDCSPDDVYRMPLCRMVTDWMSGFLREAEVDIQIQAKGGEHIDEHRYIKTGSFIIDATWQQFIPNPGTDDLPRVYVGSREGLQDLAQLNGAAAWAINLWDEHAPPPHRTVYERIAAAIDQRMP
jgi:hypothetical protein